MFSMMSEVVADKYTDITRCAAKPEYRESLALVKMGLLGKFSHHSSSNCNVA